MTIFAGENEIQASSELFNFVTMIKLDQLKYRSGSHDDQVVYKELIVDDMYRFEQLATVTKLYENWVCIDGGGHIGLFSILLSEYVGGDIYTFEPNPDSFEYCKWNTQNYKKITPLQKGLDYKQDYIRLFPPQKRLSTGSWSMVPTENHDIESSIEVETIDLADFIRSYSDMGKTILLKLDLEGYEAVIIDNLPDKILANVKILILEEHHRKIDHYKLQKIGFRLLFHPANSPRHFVYFNVSQESPLLKKVLNVKCYLGDKYYEKKITDLIEQSKITPQRIITAIRNVFVNK